MIVEQRALARLRFSERNARRLGKRAKFPMRLAVPHAAAQNQQRFFRGSDHRRGFFDRLRLRLRPRQPMHALPEERFGIIVRLALDVLRNRNADRAGIRRIRQRAERGNHRAHQLLGPHDTVPIAADRAERVVRRDRKVVRLFDLLQHGIRLAAGVHVARQNQYRNVVRRRRRRRRHHVRRAGADGRRDRNDLLALHLLGERNGGVRHALLVFALPHLEPMRLLPERLSEPDDVAVTGQHDHALHKRMLDAVVCDVLIFQEAHQCLRHGQTNGFHILLLIL